MASEGGSSSQELAIITFRLLLFCKTTTYYLNMLVCGQGILLGVPFHFLGTKQFLNIVAFLVSVCLVLVSTVPCVGSHSVIYLWNEPCFRNQIGNKMEYYCIDQELVQKTVVVLFCTVLFWKIIKHMSTFLVLEKEPVRVLVTGAAGQIGYAIVPMIARGIMLGPEQPVILHLLDIEAAADALNGVRMELIDGSFPLVKGIAATCDVAEACKDVNVAVMLGGFPRKEGMERKDVMSKNVSIYKAQASALEKYASPDCKVVVVANPANTNALILKEFAPSISEKNVTSLSRLDHNRALGQISERLKVDLEDVKNVIIWGNHSSTQYPDVNHATVTTSAGPKPVRQLVNDDEWLNGEFISTVQQRGAAVIKARKLSSALSAASATCDHVRDWLLGTPKGSWVSMGVYSDGSYGIEKGIIYSFPVTCQQGKWSIVQGLKIDELSRAKMDATAKELIEEKSLAYSCLT